MLWPPSTMSRMMSIVPKTARPMRQVRPTTFPARLRMALIRWRVALDPGAVVVAEDADVIHDVADVGLGHLALEEHLLPVGETRLRAAAKIHHDLEQVAAVGERAQPRHDLLRERRHQVVQVVGRLSPRHWCHAASSHVGAI